MVCRCGETALMWFTIAMHSSWSRSASSVPLTYGKRDGWDQLVGAGRRCSEERLTGVMVERCSSPSYVAVRWSKGTLAERSGLTFTRLSRRHI